MTQTLTPPDHARNHPAARRLRAALALVLSDEKQARAPHLPLEARQRALVAANEHLGQAWAALVAWSVEGGDAALVATAAEFVGAINRRLPLLGAMLRAEAGAGFAANKEAA